MPTSGSTFWMTYQHNKAPCRQQIPAPETALGRFIAGWTGKWDPVYQSQKTQQFMKFHDANNSTEKYNRKEIRKMYEEFMWGKRS